MAIDEKILDELLKNYKNPEDLLGDDGILRQLTKSLLERAMETEMTDHLGYQKNSPDGNGSGNSRNGHSNKTVTGKAGKIHLNVPRDRNGEFDPKIVKKRQKRFDGFLSNPLYNMETFCS